MKKIEKFVMLLAAFFCLVVCGAWKNNDPQQTSIRYEDSPFISVISDVTVNHTNRIVNADIQTLNGIPKYEPFGSLTNACGAVAGAIAVGFYDKFYPNLIPYYESYFSASGRYKAQDSVYIPSVMNTLYDLMRTNIDGPGVTEEEFKNGLRSYVNSNGYNFNCETLINGKFSLSAYLDAVSNNKVAALLVQPGYLYNIGLGNGFDLVNEIYIAGNHIMIAYGYYEVSYYMGSVLIRKDSYLRVATGQPGVTTALYKVVESQLDAAYVLNIS